MKSGFLDSKTTGTSCGSSSASECNSSSSACKASIARTPSTALIVHPDWHHTLPLEPLTVSFWDECCDAVLTRIAAGTLSAGNHHQTLASLMLVNQRCRRIAEADLLWRQLCIQRFNTPPHLNSPDMSWREVYRFNHEAFKWLLTQTAAEALMKFGIGSNSDGFALGMPLNVA